MVYPLVGKSNASVNDYGYLIGAISSSYSSGAVIDYCYYKSGTCDSNKTVGVDTGVTYTYGINFAEFTNSGSVSTLSSTVLGTTDALTALNNWIESPALGNDATYSIYKKWSYDTNGYPSLTASPAGGPGGGLPTNVAGLTSAPSTGTFEVESLTDISKISDWVAAGFSMENLSSDT